MDAVTTQTPMRARILFAALARLEGQFGHCAADRRRRRSLAEQVGDTRIEHLDREIVDLDRRRLGAVFVQTAHPDHRSATRARVSSPWRSMAMQAPSRKIQPASRHGLSSGSDPGGRGRRPSLTRSERLMGSACTPAVASAVCPGCISVARLARDRPADHVHVHEGSGHEARGWDRPQRAKKCQPTHMTPSTSTTRRTGPLAARRSTAAGGPPACVGGQTPRRQRRRRAAPRRYRNAAESSRAVGRRAHRPPRGAAQHPKKSTT